MEAKRINLLTVQEAAKLAGVAYTTIWRAILAGRLKAYLTAGGTAHLIKPADLRAWLKAR